MIDSQLHFKAVDSLGVGTHHDARIVYEDIHLLLLCKEHPTHTGKDKGVLMIFFFF